MEISAKLRAVIEPKTCVFSTRDINYFNDPRWKDAEKLAGEAKFAECQRLVEKIDRTYGKIY